MYSAYCFVLLLVLVPASIQANNCLPNTTNIQNCFYCTPNTNVCACSTSDFYIIGQCIDLGYPCKKSSLRYLYDYAFAVYNMWDSKIAPFWNSTLYEIVSMNNQTNYTIPPFLNNLSFSSMPYYLKEGWTQAYFLYLDFQSEINTLDGVQKFNLFLQGLQFVQVGIINKTLEQIWVNIVTFINNRSLTQSPLTVSSLKEMVRQRTKSKIPCHECVEKYGLIQTNNMISCSPCPPRCLSCVNDASQCQRCIDDYKTNLNGVCTYCQIKNCQTCERRIFNGSLTESCTKCDNGFSLNQNKCIQCSQNCSQCKNNNPSNCSLCLTSIFNPLPRTSGSCQICDQPECLQCSLTNSAVCLECAQGFWKVGTTCEKCQQNCVMCRSSSDCLRCHEGFGLVNGNCQKCTGVNCLTCNLKLSQCTKCSDQFVLSQAKKQCLLRNFTQNISAKTLRPGCNQAYQTQPQKCFDCGINYYQYGRDCKKCMEGCKKCQDADNCLDCHDQYELINNTCLQCPNFCSVCSFVALNKPLSCSRCIPGYFLNSNKNCVSIADDGALQIDFINKTICRPGFTAVNGNCIQCIETCTSSCNPLNITQCIQVKYKYTIQKLKPHSLKQDGCSFFINGQCLMTDMNYYTLVNNNGVISAKQSCLYPCISCLEDICIGCPLGYNLVNGKCVINLSCNPNCSVCPESTQRNLTNGRCIQCSPNCQSCLRGSCLSCYQGFYVNQSNSCMSCPKGCRTCIDSQNCDSCQLGYYLPLQIFTEKQTKSCLKCSSSCLTCSVSRNLCTSCSNDSTLRNGRCVYKFQIQFEYRLNISYANFLNTGQSGSFIEAISKGISISSNNIYLKNVRNGSTLINGYVAVISQETASNVIGALNRTDLTSFSVLSYNLTYNNQVISICISGCGKKKTDYGLVIGLLILIVGSAAFLICAVSIILYKRKSQPHELLNNQQTTLKTTENTLGSGPESANNLQKYEMQLQMQN